MEYSVIVNLTGDDSTLLIHGCDYQGINLIASTGIYMEGISGVLYYNDTCLWFQDWSLKNINACDLAIYDFLNLQYMGDDQNDTASN